VEKRVLEGGERTWKDCQAEIVVGVLRVVWRNDSVGEILHTLVKGVRFGSSNSLSAHRVEAN